MNHHAVAKLSDVDTSRRVIRFVLSTAVQDRANDTVALNGWQLDNYKKNPVVLWGHQSWTPPVGKAPGIGFGVKGLEADVEFATEEEHKLADTVFRLLKGGFLNAGSVGFRPLKWSYNETTRGYDFTEQELLEFSIVSVPCNPDALAGARKSGIDLSPLKHSLGPAPLSQFSELRNALSATESAEKAAPAVNLLKRSKSRFEILDAEVRLLGQ